MSRKKAYAEAGVDIDLGNRVKSGLPQLLASTHRPEVLGNVGGFGGLFALDMRRHRKPVLVSSVDGVGTKLKIAFAMDRHDTIGQDLVNHCVNDIAVIGAEPLFFLDYLGTGRLEPRVFEAIIRGFAMACKENHCALIGGETAQLPGFYQQGEYDLSGTIVGVVERSAIMEGPKTIRPGDVILGIASSGLHTNGYSLARKIFFERLHWKPTSHVAELGNTIGDELLKVHVSYWPLVRALLRRFNTPSPSATVGRRRANRGASSNGGRAARTQQTAVRAFAHITGGGFIDNIPRVLPPACDAEIHRGSWDIPPIFRIIQQKGEVAEPELYQVFNMGIGIVAIVSPATADAALRLTHRRGHQAWIIGEITRGTGAVQLR
jgi:phosphoribosylformylglycinamidine cyclo-ligase